MVAPKQENPTMERSIATSNENEVAAKPVRGVFWNLRQDCDRVAEGRYFQMLELIGGPDRDRPDDLFPMMEEVFYLP